eukprot:5079583-Lingulodinium_polyedra.AAC.1
MTWRARTRSRQKVAAAVELRPPPDGVVDDVDAEDKDADPGVEDDAVDKVLKVLLPALPRAK